MNNKVEKIFFYLFLFISFLIVVWIDISANATFDSGDGIQHYLIARYSWKHPQLLLDLWSKPFFTLISSPFAQFGLKGMIIFQALCAIVTCYFVYKIARKINIEYAWTTPAFVIFSPIYFAVINSGLTEIFFGCMLMLSLWLIIEKKFITSAIVSSFLPFVRAEGYLILFLIVIILFLKKQILPIPFLLSASFLYTLIGYFYYKDIFWIITNNYKINGEGYENMKGSFFHFITHYDEIWGTVYSVLLVTGIGSILYSIVQIFYKKTRNDFIHEETFLILGSFLGCLILHSALNSITIIFNNYLGMMRYMTVLIPSSAILALKGLNLISITPLRKNFYPRLIVVLVILFFIVKTPFKQRYYPFRLNNEQLVMNEVGKWLKLSSLKNKKICYLSPCFAVAAAIDPFDEKKITLLWSLDKEHLNTLPDSTIIVWDSHFAPREGKLPLNKLAKDTNFIPIKHYSYYQKDFPLEAWVFIKVDSNIKRNIRVDSEIVTDFGLLSDLKKADSIFFDFDSTTLADKTMLSENVFFSGHTALQHKSANEWGPVFSKPIKEIRNYNALKMVKVDFKFFPCDSVKDIIAVIEIKNGDKIITWYGEHLPEKIIINNWNSFEFQKCLFPNEIYKNYVLNFYFWNRGRNNFYVDDITINYYY